MSDSDQQDKLSVHLNGIMLRVLDELAERGLLNGDEMVEQEDPSVAMMFSFLYLYQHYAEHEPSAMPPPYDVLNSFIPCDETTGRPEKQKLDS